MTRQLLHRPNLRGIFALLGGLFVIRCGAAAPDFGVAVVQSVEPAAVRLLAADGDRVEPATPAPAAFADATLKWTTSTTREGLELPRGLPWTKTHSLAFDSFYDSEHCGMLQVRFYAKGETSPRFTAGLSLLPRVRARLSLPLERLDAQEVFLPRTAGRLKGIMFGRRLAAEEIERVTLALEDTGDRQTLYLGSFALLGGAPDHPLADAVLVDEFGQWTGRSWPGRTPDEAALKQQLQSALNDAARAKFPAGWSRFGGWTAKQFKATGFFRTEHDGRRWWLVDPEGNAFFSAGLDCVSAGESAAILRGTEKLFRWLPDASGSFAAAVGGRRGDSFGVNFGKANLIRAFGEDWRSAWRQLAVGRLIDWRFNTIANWSELELLRPMQLPYVIQLGRYPTTRTRLFRDFPDVFAPEFRESAKQYARGLEGVKDDPLLVGYFLSNEPVWGFGKFNLAAEMLEANPGTATRRELAAWGRKKYKDDTAAWSKAWGRELKSFDDLVTQNFHRIADGAAGVEADLWEFSREMVRAYVRIPCEEARRVDPHHLNLGMRYAWIASDLFYDAGEQFDVFSINCYQMEPAFDVIDTIAKRTGKPVMIGEYHFGALDRGLPATGLRGVASQSERGVAYRRYLETGAANPNLVGAHYFILTDQAVLGRFDGENYQIGLVDVCHTPYTEMVEMVREAHLNLYDVMTGNRPPFAQKAKEVPKIK